MKISSRGRYGLKAMVDLALNYGPQFISLKDIAVRQNIPLKYLEQIIGLLHKGGLVKSVKGSQGGYQLARDPSNIKVSSILKLLEGKISESDKILNIDNIDYAISATVYNKADEAVLSLLNGISIEDIVNYHKKLNNETLNFEI